MRRARGTPRRAVRGRRARPGCGGSPPDRRRRRRSACRVPRGARARTRTAGTRGRRRRGSCRTGRAAPAGAAGRPAACRGRADGSAGSRPVHRTSPGRPGGRDALRARPAPPTSPGRPRRRRRRGQATRPPQERGEGIDRRRVGRGGAEHGADGSGGLALLVGGLVPVVHRHDHEGGAAPGRRGVVRALDRARDVLRGDRLLDLHRVLARKAGELAREERLVREVPPVLLADEHDQRRAVHARGGERADGVAEPGGRVQEDEGRLAASDRVAGRHPDDRALVQAEDEGEVLR